MVPSRLFSLGSGLTAGCRLLALASRFRIRAPHLLPSGSSANICSLWLLRIARYSVVARQGCHREIGVIRGSVRRMGMCAGRSVALRRSDSGRRGISSTTDTRSAVRGRRTGTLERSYSTSIAALSTHGRLTAPSASLRPATWRRTSPDPTINGNLRPVRRTWRAAAPPARTGSTLRARSAHPREQVVRVPPSGDGRGSQPGSVSTRTHVRTGARRCPADLEQLGEEDSHISWSRQRKVPRASDNTTPEWCAGTSDRRGAA